MTGELSHFSVGAVTGRSWLGFAYLVTIGSGIGYTTYVWLLRVAPLPKIATYAYVNPIVAFVLSAIVLGEAISARTVVAAVVIVVGVAIIVTARSRSSDGPRHERDHRSGRPPGAGSNAAPSPGLLGGTRRLGRLGLRDHRPSDASGEDHDRDHRVDPDRGREQ